MSAARALPARAGHRCRRLHRHARRGTAPRRRRDGDRCRQSRPVLRRRTQGGAARPALRRIRSSASRTSTLPTRRPAAALFRDGGFTEVIHLAAQPGVRHSLTQSRAYVTNNLVAFGHVVEGCRHARVAHLVYASSSSVYGANHALPFSEDQNVDHPISLYAATKKANELIAHAYSHLYRIPTTGLRFFTVYGPWGRPDMAPMLFAKAILAGDADRRVQRREPAPRFHLHRRHRRRRRARARPATRSGRRRRALRDLQHRQPRVGRARDVHRDARRAAGPRGDPASTRRCSRATSRRPMRRSTGCPRSTGFAPSTPLCDRARALRRVVPRVLSGPCRERARMIKSHPARGLDERRSPDVLLRS